MIFKVNKLNFNLILTIVFLFAFNFVFAVADNVRKKIHIESDTQSLDLQNNVITFTGHVVVTQGEIIINADKIVVTRPSKKQDKEIIDGYGNPVTFYQEQNNGKKIKGCAFEMHFDLIKNFIVLNGNAYLEQDNNNISGEKIIYLVKDKVMQAYSKKGKRVTAVLVPSKF